jgi:hypothetical protein
MKNDPSRLFNIFFIAAAVLSLITVVARCAMIPFSHDEVATFYFYIQPGSFIPFHSHVDANGHFLVSLTSWICYKLFGSSVLSLRLPCIAAYIVLVYAVKRSNSLFSTLIPIIVLTSALLLSFNFISFFSLCRGYGLSMAFLLLSCYYFFIYLKDRRRRHLLKHILFAQLALSANLTLLFVLLVTAGIILLYQFRSKTLFKPLNILILLCHAGLLVFWARYAFYLKENGALYYGAGDSYWTVTFQSLIDTLFFRSTILDVFIVLVFILQAVYFIWMASVRRIEWLSTSRFALSWLLLVILVAAFYLLKKVMGVNYPEDRTGLFFYIFFILSLAFLLEEIVTPMRMLAMAIPALMILHIIFAFNLRAHPWRIYETMPQRFMDDLLQRQHDPEHPITIAGHRVREFFFGFMNYNNPAKLNHITSPEALQMNCDYALAYKADKPYYNRYYREIDTEPYWDFVLLERIKPIERLTIADSAGYPAIKSTPEYYNFFEITDTSFKTENPLQADIKLTYRNVPVPFNAWLVLQVDGTDGGTMLVRTPLNLVKHNLNGTSKFTLSLVSGNLPAKIKRLVVYLWNIDKKEIELNVDSFRLYQLYGEGVTEISKAKI